MKKYYVAILIIYVSALFAGCQKNGTPNIIDREGDTAIVDLSKVSSPDELAEAIMEADDVGITKYVLKGDYAGFAGDPRDNVSNPFKWTGAEVIDFSGVYGWPEVSYEEITGNEVNEIRETGLPGIAFGGVGEQGAYPCLREVVFPEEVRIIGDFAFAECTALETVSAPGLKYVCPAAFMNCRSVGTVDYPEVEKIGVQAFEGCESLQNVNLESVVSVGNDAFNGCVSLAGVNMENLTKLDSRVFYGCKSLVQAGFPSVADICSDVFAGCVSLKKASFPKASHIEKLAFDLSGFEELEFSVAGDMDIEQYAFYSGETAEIVTSACTIVLNKDKMPGGGATPEADPETDTWVGVQWQEIRFVD